MYLAHVLILYKFLLGISDFDLEWCSSKLLWLKLCTYTCFCLLWFLSNPHSYLCLFMISAVPKDMDYHQVLNDIKSIPGVKSAHSLALWALTVDKNAVTVHISVGQYTEYRVIFALLYFLLFNTFKLFFPIYHSPKIIMFLFKYIKKEKFAV